VEENNQTGLRNLPRNVWALTATSFFTDISSEMILNLVPLFLANVLGVGTAVIGMIDGIAETTASLLKLYSGAPTNWASASGWQSSAMGFRLSPSPSCTLPMPGAGCWASALPTESAKASALRRVMP
jgi:hypothetical protein